MRLLTSYVLIVFFFFFQAEDGIRDVAVTGVQTCALPISTIAAKNIGFELRCADPIPMDMEYTRDLGYCAAKYVLGGGNAAMISLQAGRFVPIPFTEMIDPATGRARTRRGDITSTRYALARRDKIGRAHV